MTFYSSRELVGIAPSLHLTLDTQISTRQAPQA